MCLYDTLKRRASPPPIESMAKKKTPMAAWSTILHNPQSAKLPLPFV